MDEVDEVGGLGGIDVRWGEAERLGLARDASSSLIEVGIDHGFEDEVATFEGAVGVFVWIEEIGPLDHSGDEGTLGKIELAHVLAEVGLGRPRRSR